MVSRSKALFTLAFLVNVVAMMLVTVPAYAQPQAPDYYQCRLDSIFPVGGKQGTSVTVEFRGRKGGLASPSNILIEGAPGITVSELKAVSNNNAVQAKFTIAADAPLGRRWVRVVNGQSGVTNFAHFVVSGLAEHIEKEKNDSPTVAEEVSLPVVVNGCINPKADIDCFQFSAMKGRNLVVAVAAHSLDIHGYGSNYGIADFTLELLDHQGRVMTESLDSIGYDPLIEFKVPATGEYTARIKMVAYNGFPDAVYRLTIGEVPYVTSVFPASIQRGSRTTEVELRGPNVPPGTRQTISASTHDSYPLMYLTLPGATSGQDVSVHRGNVPSSVENEPNNQLARANDLAMNTAVNGLFETKDDADWYRIRLTDTTAVFLQVLAHRFIRSPVDTYLEVYDAEGKLIAENDDDRSTDPGFASYHDFRTTDSGLRFQPEAAGEYFVRITDSNGQQGPRAIYRLKMSPYSGTPDFRLRHYPDAVPIWGPGSSAALQVRIDRLAYMNEDIEIQIEGLPEGWRGSRAVALALNKERKTNPYKDRIFLTITAPDDASIGTVVPFRIVGRVKHDDKIIERISYPLTWFYTSDTGFFRITQQALAAVAKPQGVWLESTVEELTITQGDTPTIPVRVHSAKDLKEIPLVVNLAKSIQCNVGTPTTLPIKGGIAQVPLVATDKMPIGTFAITVALSWRSDIRAGMPGPCTSIIQLHVQPKKAPTK